MADYLVQGKKGNGKTLILVSRIRDALLQGRPVATNLDLNLDKLLPPRTKHAICIRLPDYPTRADLDALGKGNTDMGREDMNGMIVLDETAQWLNARDYQDKQRKAVLDWFTESRKDGWDTYFICQGVNQIDKQLRENLADYCVTCRRLDRLKVPLLPMKMPRLHFAFVKYGFGPHDIVTDRWTYRGTDLFPAYDTAQKFRADYPHGQYCYLPPWHLGGHAYRSPLERLKDAIRADLERRSRRPAPKPKQRLVELLMVLPPEQRSYHWRRLEALGAFEAGTSSC